MKFLFFQTVFILFEAFRSRTIEENSEYYRSPLPMDRNLKENEDFDIFCNKKLLQSYGLKGNTKVVMDTHLYCPLINQNCCTLDD